MLRWQVNGYLTKLKVNNFLFIFLYRKLPWYFVLRSSLEYYVYFILFLTFKIGGWNQGIPGKKFCLRLRESILIHCKDFCENLWILHHLCISHFLLQKSTWILAILLMKISDSRQNSPPWICIQIYHTFHIPVLQLIIKRSLYIIFIFCFCNCCCYLLNMKLSTWIPGLESSWNKPSLNTEINFLFAVSPHVRLTRQKNSLFSHISFAEHCQAEIYWMIFAN